MCGWWGSSCPDNLTHRNYRLGQGNVAGATGTTESLRETQRGAVLAASREGTPGSVPACGTGPIWDVSEASQCALGTQQQVVLGLLLLVAASESCSSLSKVCILGVGAVPLQYPGDSRGGSLLVLLQATSSLPTGQPLELRFLPVLWSLVLQQSFCSHGQRDLWLPGC